MNHRKVAQFLIATFSINSVIALLFYLSGLSWQGTAAMVVAVLYMMVPAAVTFVLQRFVYKEPLKTSMKIHFTFNRWFFVAWLAPLVLVAVTIGISLLFPSLEFSSEMAGMFERFESLLTEEQLTEMRDQLDAYPLPALMLLILVQSLIAGITVNALIAFGEELGWRGLMQRELCGLGFWKSSLVIGVAWGFWHAPLILQGHNYPSYPLIGVFMMTIWTILLSPWFAYITFKARSVIAASILHGSLNACGGLAMMFIYGGDELLIGLTGLAGFIALAVANLVLYILIRRDSEFEMHFRLQSTN